MIKKFKSAVLVFFAFISLSICDPVSATVLPIIDAHSQFDEDVSDAQLIEQAARAGVSQVLLSARGRVTTARVLNLASSHPSCVIPSVRTKSNIFFEDSQKFEFFFQEQLRNPAFKAMNEIILLHAQKGSRAKEVDLPENSPQVKRAIQQAITKGWPVVLHYEMRWLSNVHGADARTKRIAELKSLVSQYPQHSFGLIHMAQLDVTDAAQLLSSHPNIFFLTSHSNPIVVNKSKQPWTNLMNGQALAPEWKSLMLRYPAQFVLAIDNVWAGDWSEKYVRQVELWRKALGELPLPVAHAIAHMNAERLWRLSPAVAGEGCASLRGLVRP